VDEVPFAGEQGAKDGAVANFGRLGGATGNPDLSTPWYWTRLTSVNTAELGPAPL
jgi:hypothetical protein